MTGARNIRAKIEARLASWNRAAYKKLVFNSYAMATGYLGRSRETQNMEQRHRTFLKLFLRGKVHESVRFFCEREIWVVLGAPLIKFLLYFSKT